MKKIRTLGALVMLLLSTSGVWADIVVITNLQNSVEQLSKTQVINIFLGNNREYPNGLTAKPFDLPATAPEKSQFYRALVNKDLDQMAAYWSRLIFAGNTSPPSLVPSGQDVVQIVSANRNAIAYLDRKNADTSRVKIVFSLP